MGKEQALLKHVLSLPKTQLSQIKGKPHEMLKIIDTFSSRYRDPSDFFIHIGDRASIVVDEMKKANPHNMMELGGYVGYSAILFGNEISKVNGKYYSFEMSEEFANIARHLIDIAGLEKTIEIIVGPTGTTLPNFFNYNKGSNNFDHVKPMDFIFMDHDMQLYHDDVRVLETVGAIGKGTVMVADNIITPGSPLYHNYVHLTPEQKREYINAFPNSQGQEYVGRPELVYDTKLVEFHGLFHDALDITKCVDEQK